MMSAHAARVKQTRATNPETRHFSQALAQAHAASGPVSFLNPTTRIFPARTGCPTEPEAKRPKTDRQAGPELEDSTAPVPASASTPDQPDVPDRDAVWHVWRSRNNRKGRHAVAVTPEYHHAAKAVGKAAIGQGHPKQTVSWRETLAGLSRMVLEYPVWDISYDVAVIFTWGSVIWVINGFFVLLPLVNPSLSFPNEASLGGGLTAFIGATVFEVGSILLLLEAVNENREACFGWAVVEELELASGRKLPALQRDDRRTTCRHSHVEKRSLLQLPPRSNEGDAHGIVGEGDNDSSRTSTTRRWTWWPTVHELRTHYLRELGFLASATQLVAATIFWIAGLTGLPPIYDRLSVVAANGAYWLPQVVGGSGFVVSGALFMLETQERWWKPAPRILGWHIGFWNIIGAIGFTLCGALGFGEGEGIEYALTLATFVGSWAFLIGSTIQWYESLAKYPMTVEKDLPALPQN